VSTIAPTLDNNPFVAALPENEKVRKKVLSRIPMGGPAEVEEVLGTAVFLARHASEIVTGHTLVTDGGWTAV
jgi:NAD(P)-dependent dehydrogenase (short-subunit alcohol dehydrogenase family)